MARVFAFCGFALLEKPDGLRLLCYGILHSNSQTQIYRGHEAEAQVMVIRGNAAQLFTFSFWIGVLVMDCNVAAGVCRLRFGLTYGLHRRS